jgi:acetyl/propionyl-CoA carboxylase alpha subunit
MRSWAARRVVRRPCVRLRILSENAAFAEDCARAGVAFVGRRRRSGHGLEVRGQGALMEQAGVP